MIRFLILRHNFCSNITEVGLASTEVGERFIVLARIFLVAVRLFVLSRILCDTWILYYVASFV